MENQEQAGADKELNRPINVTVTPQPTMSFKLGQALGEVVLVCLIVSIVALTVKLLTWLF